jgi:hypothetical protein
MPATSALETQITAAAAPVSFPRPGAAAAEDVP